MDITNCYFSNYCITWSLCKACVGWRCRKPRHRQGLWVRSSLSVLVIVLAVIIVFGVAVIGVAVIGVDIIVLVVVV